MITCIVDCKRKAVATLCACETETEAVDLSDVTLAAVVLIQMQAFASSRLCLQATIFVKYTWTAVRSF